MKKTISWLKSCGYDVVDVHDNRIESRGTFVSINVVPHHLIDEADRLVSILKNHKVDITIGLKIKSLIWIDCAYFPESGTAHLYLYNINDELLFNSID